jgi:hypothetical protein
MPRGAPSPIARNRRSAALAATSRAAAERRALRSAAPRGIRRALRPLAMALRLSSLAVLSLTALAAACSTSSDVPSPGASVTGDGDDAGTGAPVAHADAGEPVVDAAQPSADAASPATDATPGTDAVAPPIDAAPPDAGPPAKQVLIWIWQDYANALDQVTQHASSFTHVSPALYQLNFDYASGPAKLVNENDDFSGLHSADFAPKAHAAGLACAPLMYAGAGNFGTDQGIQNVLDDKGGAQSNFIQAMVQEGVDKGFDGFNLDWEVQGTDDTYADKLVTFLRAFKTALHAHGMTLSIDIAGWYVKQCTGSNGTGLVDLSKLGDSVDQAIFEDYSGAFKSSATSCPAPPPLGAGGQDCDGDFSGGLAVMCDLAPSVVSVGLISTGTNSFADRALSAVGAYGFRNVAVWPDDAQFLNPSGIPNGGDWYSLLAAYRTP